jgi:uncharacterized protein (TIGR02231 family)
MKTFPLLILVAAVPAAQAMTVDATKARIVDVTAYPDRAEVVREVTVDVPSGASMVQFKDIPATAEADSLRVTAKGVPAVLGAVTIRMRADAPKETPEQIALRDEVKRLERELAKLASQDRVSAELRDFLKSLRASTAQRSSEEIGAGKSDPASIAAVYDLMARRLNELGESALTRSDAAAKLARDLEIARAKLSAAPAAGSIRSRVADAEIDAKQAGPLTLRLSYLVAGASWTPAYRATLDPASGEIALVSEAVVRQGTGEDWNGVSLRLSTAAPARGVAPPEMESLLLRPMPAERDFKTAAGGIAYERPAPARFHQNNLPIAPDLQAYDALEKKDAEIAQAEIVHSAYNVAFEVPGKPDVPADGADHRVVLRQESLPGTLTYRAAPSLEEAVFLTSVVRAPAQYPLLAGAMRVLAGGAYLGVYGVPETAPGAELNPPFGRDNRIKIARVEQPEVRSFEGLTNRTGQVAHQSKTTVENLRDRAVTVVVEDRVPVSEDERIVVEMGKATTADHTPSKTRPGVVSWKLTLAPHEKKDVVLSYTVRYPKEMLVAGLE